MTPLLLVACLARTAGAADVTRARAIELPTPAAPSGGPVVAPPTMIAALTVSPGLAAAVAPAAPAFAALAFADPAASPGAVVAAQPAMVAASGASPGLAADSPGEVRPETASQALGGLAHAVQDEKAELSFARRYDGGASSWEAPAMSAPPESVALVSLRASELAPIGRGLRAGSAWLIEQVARPLRAGSQLDDWIYAQAYKPRPPTNTGRAKRALSWLLVVVWMTAFLPISIGYEIYKYAKSLEPRNLGATSLPPARALKGPAKSKALPPPEESPALPVNS